MRLYLCVTGTDPLMRTRSKKLNNNRGIRDARISNVLLCPLEALSNDSLVAVVP